jgi:hypothetical protein
VGCNRVFLEMFLIMLSANRTGYENIETFVKFFGGLFVGVAWFLGIAQSNYMNCVPEKGSPCFRRYMHSSI